MYIPPFESLLQALKKTKSDLDNHSSIEIPVDVFKLLLQAAIIGEVFDEESYLQKNPDVRKAIRDGDIESGFDHYIEFGYFEGRKGGAAEVDERWYVSKYQDIAAAVKNGKEIEFAREHFLMAGAAEGRSPSAEHEVDAEQWRKAFQAAR